MYRPAHFTEDDIEVLVALVRTAGFGHLVAVDDSGLTSTPLPLLISDDGKVIRGHLARPNQFWRIAPCQAIAIVPVSDTYISPTWFPSKAEHGRVVPTWNYEVVHAHGRLVAHDDPDWIAEQIRDLTDLNESGFASPWSIDDAPAGYIAKMAGGIVGVELIVDRLEGKRKLSQNRSDDDLAGTIANLIDSERRGASAIRDAMIDADGQPDAR